MTSVCLYFKIHQPFQLQQYHPKDIEVNHCYEDAGADRAVINKLADECYLPANARILTAIYQTKGAFRVCFSISGTALELLQLYRPDVITSFRELVETGCVEILAETYYHSLSFLYSINEFKRQVRKHTKLVHDVFGVSPVIFRNTELIHNNSLADCVASLGYRAILCEGNETILGSGSPNHLYQAPGKNIPLLLRNSALSDDIAFRFGDTNWSEHPLTAEKMAEWIHHHPVNTEVINLFLDYETFGIHKKAVTGIFEFLEALPGAILGNPGFDFQLPSCLLDELEPVGCYNATEPISWTSQPANSDAWSQNVMQNNTLKKIYSIEKMVTAAGLDSIIETWGKLQSADFFYYMSGERAKGDQYKYRNPFESPDAVFHYYTNIVIDFEISLIRRVIALNKKKQTDRVTGVF